ncbi:MAG: hypothetical protein RSC99_09230, partial [Clostridiales bacterium]
IAGARKRRRAKVVVPHFFLLWYNKSISLVGWCKVVVPHFFLLWYNFIIFSIANIEVVVPHFFLLWYNAKQVII